MFFGEGFLFLFGPLFGATSLSFLPLSEQDHLNILFCIPFVAANSQIPAFPRHSAILSKKLLEGRVTSSATYFSGTLGPQNHEK